MSERINKFEKNETVGFAHSIASDLYDFHAGIAVVFKNHFGKPKPHHRLSSHLASVYSLITKARYFL